MNSLDPKQFYNFTLNLVRSSLRDDLTKHLPTKGDNCFGSFPYPSIPEIVIKLLQLKDYLYIFIKSYSSFYKISWKDTTTSQANELWQSEMQTTFLYDRFLNAILRVIVCFSLAGQEIIKQGKEMEKGNVF